jgi:hypothetical protein
MHVHVDAEDQRVKMLTESVLYELLPAVIDVMIPPAGCVDFTVLEIQQQQQQSQERLEQSGLRKCRVSTAEIVLSPDT